MGTISPTNPLGESSPSEPGECPKEFKSTWGALGGNPGNPPFRQWFALFPWYKKKGERNPLGKSSPSEPGECPKEFLREVAPISAWRNPLRDSFREFLRRSPPSRGPLLSRAPQPLRPTPYEVGGGPSAVSASRPTPLATAGRSRARRSASVVWVSRLRAGGPPPHTLGSVGSRKREARLKFPQRM